MLSINTNLSSLIAQGSMKSSTNKLNQAIERMTTGFKINHAKDNAANYSISTNMTTKIGAYNVAEDNAAMGLDLINTAEGTLDQIQDKLQRLRALAEQASNGTYGEQSKQAINAEANALVDEIERVYNNTEYNGLKLFGLESVALTASVDNSEPIQTFSLTRTSETITSVGFLNPVEHQETSSAIAISTLEEGSVLDSSKVYSISSAEDLNKLKTMQVNGEPLLKLILSNNIDMSSIEDWNGLTIYYDDYINLVSVEFDGNGYVIQNLAGDSGLFSCQESVTIYNLGLENINIVSSLTAGAFISGVTGCSDKLYIDIDNCYVTGTIIGTGSSSSAVGGVVGCLCDIGSVNISNVVCDVDITGNYAGGLIGYLDADTKIDLDVTNSQYLGESSSLTGIYVGRTRADVYVTIEDSVYNESYDTLGIPFVSGAASVTTRNVNPVAVTINSGGAGGGSTNPPAGSGTGGGVGAGGFTPAPDTIMLQVGVASDSASQIGVNTSFVLASVDDLRMIGLDLTTDYLTQIDDMLALVSEKQTHFGAVSNRLESVLEEITIQRDNLISSRSTIRDADIAEVSSHYIQQQILQQASATLLATANQSPSIALQLI